MSALLSSMLSQEGQRMENNLSWFRPLTHTHTPPLLSHPVSRAQATKPLLVQKAHCLHFTHQWILCSKKAVKIRALLSLAFPISTFNGCGGLQCTPAVPSTVAGTSCRDFPCASWCIKRLSCLALHKGGCSPLHALCNHFLVPPSSRCSFGPSARVLERRIRLTAQADRKGPWGKAT